MNTSATSEASWPLRTDRLVVRPAEPADAGATWTYRRLPEVTEWLPSVAATPERHAAAFVDQPRLGRTLVVEHEGAVVGDLYLHLQDAWAQAEVAADGAGVVAEVGWVIDPAWGGRGLATEAVHALVTACFASLGVHRVQATCIADNVASWRLMERLGMRREGHTVRNALHRSRGWLDGYHYAVLAEEWPSAKRG